MPIGLDLWPPEIIEINRELASGLHPQLEATLAGMDSTESGWIERFATIAAYCEVALDGLYTSDQIIELCKILIPRLYELRERPDQGRAEIIIAS